VFEKIFKEMQAIHFRLDDLEKSLSNWRPQPLEITESELFSLPDHLRRTYMLVASKGECDATQTSNLTGRCRALESNYLNQLTRMGWLNKRKASKTTIYSLAQEKPLENLIIKKASHANTNVGRFSHDFKKYFAEPLATRNVKNISERRF
jgi:hypothetical protein